MTNEKIKQILLKKHNNPLLLLTVVGISAILSFTIIFVAALKSNEATNRTSFAADYSTQTTPVAIGAGANTTGNPIGGDAEYTKIISQSSVPSSCVVNTLSALKNALSVSSSCATTSPKIVYVQDSASIDMTGQENISIPAGVTLASGRGNGGSRGALLYTASFPYPLFAAGGAGVRITGLRIKGAFTEVGTLTDGIPSAAGIFAANYPSTEIDNVEMWGWTYAAVFVRDGATNAYIHHSNIHHNRKDGYGYGIVIGVGDALIEANLLDYNKHSIAASYNTPSSYEARYNIVGDNDSSWNFDRHSSLAPGGYAGDSTLIHHNTFMRLSSSQYSIRISGIPNKEALIYNNWFYRTPTSTNPVIALYDTGTTGVLGSGNPLWQNNRCSTYPSGCISNINVYDNWYGTSQPPTANDTIAPTISSTDPISNATDVIITKTISITFSENIQSSTNYGSISLRDQNGNIITTSNSAAGSSLTITLASSLAYNKTYTVTIPAGAVKDAAGNNLASQHIFSFTTTLQPPTSTSIPAKSNFVAHWNFDEGSGSTATDSSGAGNNVNLINNPVWTEGIKGKALQLNGSSSYAEVLKSSSLDSINKEITIETWVKTPLTGRGTIVERWFYNPTPQRAYVVTIETDGSIQFMLSADGATPPTGKGVLLSNKKISPNTWTHIALTSDGTTMKTYINGKQDENTASSPVGGIYNAGQNLRIGTWQYSPTAKTSYLNGIIDEVKIYNNALSASEIQADYQQGTLKYSATFSQSGASGTWGVTVGGTKYTSAASSITIPGLSGTVSYFYDPVVSATTGIRYSCSTGCSNSVTSSTTTITASYKTQYALTMSPNPSGAGTTSPTGVSWHDSGSSVAISAIPASGYTFSSWSNSDTRSYLGNSSTTTITVNNPTTQTANFVNNTPTQTPELAAYYKFDKNTGTIAYDSSTNLNHLGLVNNPVWTAGKTGNALSFNGYNQYASKQQAINIPANAPFSIMLWVNAKNFSSWADLFRKNDSWALQLNKAGNLNFEITGKQDVTSSLVVPTNQWVHLTVVYETNTVKFYRDGVLSQIKTASYPPNNISNSIYIGGYPQSQSYLNGAVDDIKIYRRVLTPSEILSDYQASKLEGPVAHWKFNENTGTTVHDSSGNNNTGTLINSPVWAAGKFGSALKFDGVSNYVNVPNTNSLNITKNITLTSWINTGVLAQNYGVIATKGSYTYYFAINYKNLALLIGNNNATTWNVVCIGNKILQNGAWYHVAGKYSSSTGKVDLYVNGVLDKSCSGTVQDIGTKTAGISIGSASSYAPTYYLKGTLDELKIYNRALTASEILTDYAQR